MKKILLTLLFFIVCFVIFIFVGLNKNNTKENIELIAPGILYESKRQELELKLDSLIGQSPYFQSVLSRAEWNKEGNEHIQKLMDELLATLFVKGVTQETTREPSHDAVFAKYDDVTIYIPVSGKSPEDRILIEEGNKFYIASASPDKTEKIIFWTNSQGIN